MLCLGLMSHTGTRQWSCLNKRAQSRLKPAHALVVKAWEALVPICRVPQSWKRDTINLNGYHIWQSWDMTFGAQRRRETAELPQFLELMEAISDWRKHTTVIGECEASWKKFTEPKKGRFPKIDDEHSTQTIYLQSGVFWDVMRCGSCKNQTRATWHNIPEDAILHSHHRENLKSYTIYLQSLNSQQLCTIYKNRWVRVWLMCRDVRFSQRRLHTVCRDVRLCSLVNCYQHCADTFYLHLPFRAEDSWVLLL
jgi:hypothetical protein